jgi:hypothetical protein
MSNTESIEAMIRAVAHDAIALIDECVVQVPVAAPQGIVIGGAALARLARLLQTQLEAASREYELFVVCARAVIETWLTGHAFVLLGPAALEYLAGRESGELSLEDVARCLDAEMYGESDKPKAFRRHLRSFFDEINVRGSEGSVAWLARYVDDGEVTRVKTSPTTTDEPVDFIRVSLWVTLFLSHDYFAAVGDPVTAKRARALFDRLRAATDDFYYSRGRTDR